MAAGTMAAQPCTECGSPSSRIELVAPGELPAECEQRDSRHQAPPARVLASDLTTCSLLPDKCQPEDLGHGGGLQLWPRKSTAMSRAMMTVLKAKATSVCPVTILRVRVVSMVTSEDEKVVCTWVAR